MFVYKQLHPAAAIICAVATLTIAPVTAPIPIPSPMTPTKIAPAADMPEPAGNTPELIVAMPESTAISAATIPISPEPEPIPSESAAKLGSWHEIVIAKSAIMTASPAITISHPAIRINIISTHAVKLSIFAVWVEMVMKVMAVAPTFLLGMPLLQVK